jgi:hypothetical protein
VSIWYGLDDEAEMNLPTSRISARLSTAPEEVLPMVATWGEIFQFSSFGPQGIIEGLTQDKRFSSYFSVVFQGIPEGILAKGKLVFCFHLNGSKLKAQYQGCFRSHRMCLSGRIDNQVLQICIRVVFQVQGASSDDHCKH